MYSSPKSKRQTKSKVSGNMRSIEKAKKEKIVQKNSEKFLRGHQCGQEYEQEGRMEISPSRYENSDRARGLKQAIADKEAEMAALKRMLSAQTLREERTIIQEEPT